MIRSNVEMLPLLGIGLVRCEAALTHRPYNCHHWTEGELEMYVALEVQHPAAEPLDRYALPAQPGMEFVAAWGHAASRAPREMSA